jgi:hypothetical protein
LSTVFWGILAQIQDAELLGTAVNLLVKKLTPAHGYPVTQVHDFIADLERRDAVLE